LPEAECKEEAALAAFLREMTRILATAGHIIEMVFFRRRGVPFFLNVLFSVCVIVPLYVLVQSCLIVVRSGVSTSVLGLVASNLAVMALPALLAFGIYRRARWAPRLIPWLPSIVYVAASAGAYALGVEIEGGYEGLVMLAAWAAGWFLYCRAADVVAYFEESPT
jgi:hypothetical protein